MLIATQTAYRPRWGLMVVNTLFAVLSFSLCAEPIEPTDTASKKISFCDRLLKYVEPVAAPTITKTIQLTDRYLSVESEPWTIRPETEGEIAQLFNSDAPDADKVRRTIELLLLDRAGQEGNWLKRWLFKSALKSGVKYKSIYSETFGRLLYVFGPHYNPLFNRSSVRIPFQDAKIDPALIYMHELTHAYDRNFKPAKFATAIALRAYNLSKLYLRIPLAPILHNRLERSAIGSQWELLQRLPEPVRQRMLWQIHNRFQQPSNAQLIQSFQKALSSGIYDSVESALGKILNADLLDDGILSIDIMAIWFPDKAGALDGLTDEGMGKEKRSERALRTLARLEELFQEIGDPLKQVLTDAEYNDLKAVLQVGAYMFVDDSVRAKVADLPDLNVERNEFLLDFFQSRLFLIEGAVKKPGFTRAFAEHATADIVRKSLANAHLSKEEFIRVMEVEHGYDLNSLAYDHLVNPWNPIRILLLTDVLLSITLEAPYFAARDVQWLWWLLH
jgi:hypothetical protein